MTWEVNIQPGHLARHMPKGASAQGREAAVIDVAQDLLLANLQEKGILQSLSLKGGTALRKFNAGKEGRFSLDLDFALTEVDSSFDKTIKPLIGAIKISPSGPSLTQRRNAVVNGAFIFLVPI